EARIDARTHSRSRPPRPPRPPRRGRRGRSPRSGRSPDGALPSSSSWLRIGGRTRGAYSLPVASSTATATAAARTTRTIATLWAFTRRRAPLFLFLASDRRADSRRVLTPGRVLHGHRDRRGADDADDRHALGVHPTARSPLPLPGFGSEGGLAARTHSRSRPPRPPRPPRRGRRGRSPRSGRSPDGALPSSSSWL